MVRMERKPTRKKMGSDMNNSSRYETHVVSKHAMCARHEQEGEENDFGVIFLVEENKTGNDGDAESITSSASRLWNCILSSVLHGWNPFSKHAEKNHLGDFILINQFMIQLFLPLGFLLLGLSIVALLILLAQFPRHVHTREQSRRFLWTDELAVGVALRALHRTAPGVGLPR